MKTVKSALLLVGLVLAGSLFAADVDDYGRRVTRPGEVILMSNSAVDVGNASQLIGHIDADVLNFRSGQTMNQVEEF